MPMAARVLDGRAVAAAIRASWPRRSKRLAAAGRRPTLAAVLVRDDEASPHLRRLKQRAAERSGHQGRGGSSSVPRRPGGRAGRGGRDSAPTTGSTASWSSCRCPTGLDPVEVQDAIDPARTSAACTPENEGRLLRGDPRFAPCTAIGIVELLRREKVPVEGSHAVIVGRGLRRRAAPGRAPVSPSAGANATVTLCHTGTRRLSEFTRQADVLVAAADLPGAVTPGHGQAGRGRGRRGQPHRVGGRIVGDVAPEVAQVAGALTPSPAGSAP